MTAKYWQKGEVLDYKASISVKNGDVVSLGTRIGVAGEDIPQGETGHLHVVGVFEMPKDPGAVTMGAPCTTTPRTAISPPLPPATCRQDTLPPLRTARMKPCW